MEVREVWRQNIAEELKLMLELIRRYRYIAVDTEFPGFLRSTPRNASKEERYRDLKSNVDSMKVIQLGITLFDEPGNMPFPRCCCWQFNFCDFDPAKDAHSEASLELLKRSGIDFDKMRRQGLEADLCSILLQDLLNSCRGLRWITFHGLYDVAYLLKLLTGAPLPDTLHGFLILAGSLLGRCYDVKHIARFCDGLLGGETGLVKMSKMMGIELAGTHHQAGYDSLLTGLLFWAIKMAFRIDEDAFVGILYGLEVNCIRGPMTAMPFHPCCSRRFFVAPPFGRMICFHGFS
ncbi:putative CCR4-associated factor 1 homolog 8 [Elaeis guineensis]|uniref:putative CCR4-associated factor 1 homolog 8 n=1 Tax=Elaeis guineensis var. tenera TaxID=51953 RepID=UPI000579CC96